MCSRAVDRSRSHPSIDVYSPRSPARASGPVDTCDPRPRVGRGFIDETRTDARRGRGVEGSDFDQLRSCGVMRGGDARPGNLAHTPSFPSSHPWHISDELAYRTGTNDLSNVPRRRASTARLARTNARRPPNPGPERRRRSHARAGDTRVTRGERVDASLV
jgi:hypothetical protein